MASMFLKSFVIIGLVVIVSAFLWTAIRPAEFDITGRVSGNVVQLSGTSEISHFCKIFGRTDAVKGTLMEAGDIPAGFIVPATGSGCMSDETLVYDKCGLVETGDVIPTEGSLLAKCIDSPYPKCSTELAFKACVNEKICALGVEAKPTCVSANIDPGCSVASCAKYYNGENVCTDTKKCYVTVSSKKVFSECVNPGTTDSSFVKFDRCTTKYFGNFCDAYSTSCNAKNSGTGWKCYNTVNSSGKFALCSKSLPAGKCATQADCVSKLGYSTKCDSTGKKVLVPWCDTGTSTCVSKAIADCSAQGNVCSNGVCVDSCSSGTGGSCPATKSCAVVTEDEPIHVWIPSDNPGSVPIAFSGFTGGTNSGGQVSIGGIKLSTKVSVANCGKDSSGNSSGASVISGSASCPWSYYISKSGQGECSVKCGTFSKPGIYTVDSTVAKLDTTQCVGTNIKTFNVYCNANNQCPTGQTCNTTNGMCGSGSGGTGSCAIQSISSPVVASSESSTTVNVQNNFSAYCFDLVATVDCGYTGATVVSTTVGNPVAVVCKGYSAPGTFVIRNATLDNCSGVINCNTAITKTILVKRCDAAGAPACPSGQTCNTTTGVCGTSVDVTPPSVPTGLKATAGNAQVSLTWNANPSSETDFVSYRINLVPGNVNLIVLGRTTTSKVVDGLTNGTPYTFVIRSKDTSGNLSVWSEEETATPTATTIYTISTTSYPTMCSAPSGGGSFSSGSSSNDITANSCTGKTFSSWTISGGCIYVSGYSSTKNPARVTVTNNCILTANYTIVPTACSGQPDKTLCQNGVCKNQVCSPCSATNLCPTGYICMTTGSNVGKCAQV